jgi:hypothetical protein
LQKNTLSSVGVILGRTFNDFNKHSEKRVEFGLKGINRLADDSE